MIKLIVTDVDGTLVEDGFTNVDPRLFDTILKLREKGIQFAVASGRPWASVERTFEPVKKKVFYISNNGSYIGCYGRSLYVYAMDRENRKAADPCSAEKSGIFHGICSGRRRLYGVQGRCSLQLAGGKL